MKDGAPVVAGKYPGRRRQNTPKETSLDPVGKIPIIEPSALLALSRWIEQRFSPSSGAQACLPEVQSTQPFQSPPAHRDDHVELSIESLESTATAEAKAPGGKPQSVGSRKFEPTKR